MQRISHYRFPDALALGVAENAAAQTTLVSNFDATSGISNVSLDREGAQAFTTGDTGATVSSVEIISADTQGDDFDLSLCTTSSNDRPTSTCTPLTAPSSFAAGTLVFTAPANTTLDPTTTYAVLMTPESASVTVSGVGSNDEDTGGAMGWTIADTHHFRDFADDWRTSTSGGGRSLRIAIKGTLTASANNAPVFANDTASRSFTETVGDAAVTLQGEVGAVVTATDADGDSLTYTLEGTDAAKFYIVSDTGQIRTDFNQKYDREAKASYSVTVKADDGNGGTDTIMVTITVDNAEEKPLAPAIPTVTATSGSTTSLDVSWTAPANTGRPAITGYKVEYRPGVSGNWINHAHTGTGTTAYRCRCSP